ncbi:MAG: hypothetical protein D6B27_01885 [Gammaproteobacteria bacterium]|nr:MAG: hypothetical protein D6B27_01885 [Gammaproteobacteria bacterium]
MFLFIKKDLLPLIGIFGINIFIHLFADSIVGDIWWFSPFTNKPYSLFTVPSIYKIWWGNFILHWSFLIEITLILIAIYIFINSRKKYSLSSGNTICIAQIFHKYAQYLIYHID